MREESHLKINNQQTFLNTTAFNEKFCNEQQFQFNSRGEVKK